MGPLKRKNLFSFGLILKKTGYAPASQLLSLLQFLGTLLISRGYLRLQMLILVDGPGLAKASCIVSWVVNETICFDFIVRKRLDVIEIERSVKL